MLISLPFTVELALPSFFLALSSPFLCSTSLFLHFAGYIQCLQYYLLTCFFIYVHFSAIFALSVSASYIMHKFNNLSFFTFVSLHSTLCAFILQICIKAVIIIITSHVLMSFMQHSHVMFSDHISLYQL